MEKHCNKCNKNKDITEFWNNKLGKDGVDWWCISCRTKVRKHYKDNPVGNGTGRKPNPVPDGMKWCGYHKKPCLKSEFTGTERSCKEGKFAYHIKRKYNLGMNQLEELQVKQKNVCAICLSEWKYVDHNHATGKVRGLLCPRCNTLVGYLETNQKNINRALEYIARNE